MAGASSSRPVLRVLFDVNVLLDVILERRPHVRTAAELLAAVERGELTALVAGISFPIIHYVVTRQAGVSEALTAIRHLLDLCEVAPITRAVLDDAVRLDFADFEDAVQHEAARHAQSDAIVTRNNDDFEAATLAVYTPNELLQAVKRH